MTNTTKEPKHARSGQEESDAKPHVARAPIAKSDTISLLSHL